MTRRKVAAILKDPAIGSEVDVRGWVRTRRESKQGFAFVELNDGSCLRNLQIVVANSVPGYDEFLKQLTTGSSVRIVGDVKASPAKGQAVEVHARELTVYGAADAEKYPLQKKGHSFEFLREIAHLRPRTNTFGAIARVRNALCAAIHDFFQSRGFLYVHTPIITTSDCEGAGQMFQVTTLDLARLAARPQQPPAAIDYSDDFFGKRASLTVSGQLEGETFACAVGDCYTFGPTFRAENSNTTRHLAEFWMVEPEMAFYDIEDNMNLAEEFIKYIISYVLRNNRDDLEFLKQRLEREESKLPQQQRSEMNLIEKLEFVVNNQFERITYTQAVDILLDSPAYKK